MSCTLVYTIVGDSGVGKSQMLQRFIQKGSRVSIPMGIDCAIYRETVLNHKVMFKIWDMPGQERFQSIAYYYMRDASVVMLVYDISDRMTFLSVRARWAGIKCHKRALFVLVGNKSDKSHREVSREEADTYASAAGFMFFECSSSIGQSVNQMFMQTAERALINHTGHSPLLHHNTGHSPLLKRLCMSCLIS
jgi:small GTP-binding protein